MNSSSSARGNLRLFLCVLLMLVSAGAAFLIWQNTRAQLIVDGTGIELSNMRVAHDEQLLYLNADARVRLPPTVEAGLDSGVPLTFVLNLKVIEPRRWWMDKTIVDVQQRYTLTYYELTRHYRVSVLETNTSRNFRSLSSALAGLGELGQINFSLDEHQLASLEHDALVGELDMRLLKSALPLPLQPIFRSSWTLESQEYRWPVI